MAASPEQILTLIERAFPDNHTQTNPAPERQGSLRALVALAKDLDHHALHIKPHLRLELDVAIETIKGQLDVWAHLGPGGGTNTGISLVPGFQRRSAIQMIHHVAEACKGRPYSRDADRFGFITDAALRDDLAHDMTEVEAALASSRWKSCTVLGGSVIEALLLNQIACTDNPPGNLDKMQLVELIRQAKRRDIIDDEEADLCRLAKGYRNLIHPGKVRSGTPCNRSTSLMVVSVIERLLARFQPQTD